jgi:hypothetical protein
VGPDILPNRAAELATRILGRYTSLYQYNGRAHGFILPGRLSTAPLRQAPALVGGPPSERGAGVELSANARVATSMGPLIRPFAILVPALSMLVGAAEAETRKPRPIPVEKNIANESKPLRITPILRTTVRRAQSSRPKAVTQSRAQRRQVGPRVGEKRSLVKRVKITKSRSRQVAPRVGERRFLVKPVIITRQTPPASIYPPSTEASQLALTAAQKLIIFQSIAETPLQPHSVTTERVLPLEEGRTQKAENIPELKNIIAEPELAVGQAVPPAVAIHQLPPSATEAIPQIGPYRYVFVGQNVWLVDPATNIVVAAIR